MGRNFIIIESKVKGSVLIKGITERIGDLRNDVIEKDSLTDIYTVMALLGLVLNHAAVVKIDGCAGSVI